MTTSGRTNNREVYYRSIVTVLFLLSLAAGYSGFSSYFNQNGEDYNFLRSLYRAIQLFTLEGGDIGQNVPWALQIARFTAPLTTLMAVIIALLEIFKKQWERIKINRMKDHIVIIGLGSKGKNIMQESLLNGEKVLVVESDPANTNLSTAKIQGSRILMANATDSNTLKKARIHKAKTVYLLMGDDNNQITTCLHIYGMIRESKRDEHNPLQCVMHLQKQDFLNSMRSHKLVKDTHDGLVLNIFNIYENSARELFVKTPPDRKGIPLNSERFVRMVIFGFGKAGEALALQTAFTGHYLNGKKPSVVIIDKLAKEKIPEFLERYPSFTEYCDIDFLSLDANSPQLIYRLSEYLKDRDALTTICLCFDNKTQNLLLGLQLESIQQQGKELAFELFVRTNDNSYYDTFSHNLKPYGLPSKVCSKEAIFDGALDKKAKAIHTNYLKKRREEADYGNNDADVSWEDLSQELKDSNRKAADHIGVKVRGIGCEIVSVNDPRPAALFSEKETEELSELEHRRWNAVHSLAGWTFGKQKDSKTRKTPYLTVWNDLPESIKDYDRDAVRNIPGILKLEKLKIVRAENDMSVE